MILYVVGLVPYILELRASGLSLDLRGAIVGVENLMQLAAIYCVFSTDARPWFSRAPTNVEALFD